MSHSKLKQLWRALKWSQNKQWALGWVGAFGNSTLRAQVNAMFCSVPDAPARQRWRCMQPRLCPFCWKTFSNSFNLKQHIVNVHTVGEGIECELCHKVVKNKWYLRKHHVTAHGAPLRRSKGPAEAKSGKALANQLPASDLPKDVALPLTPTPHQVDTSQPQEVFTKKQMDRMCWILRVHLVCPAAGVLGVLTWWLINWVTVLREDVFVVEKCPVSWLFIWLT